MRRRLFNLLTVVSLVSCAAVAVAWGRSYFRADFVCYTRHRSINDVSFRAHGYEISSSTGGLALSRYTEDTVSDTPERSANERRQSGYVFDDAYRFEYMAIPWQRYGGVLPWKYQVDPGRDLSFGFAHRSVQHARQSSWMLVVPWACLCLPLAVLPATRLTRSVRRRHRERRRARGLCPVCNYDLRATPERCPECGSAAPVRG